MSADIASLLAEDEDRILPLLRLAKWASEASPVISQLSFLRNEVPSLRQVLDPLTPELNYPEIRNAGELVAGVLNVAIDLLESRSARSEGGAA